jgi:hypothetical protein
MAHGTARRIVRVRPGISSVAVLSMLLCAPLGARATEQVYVWRDASGVVRFSAIDAAAAAQSDTADRAETNAPQCEVGFVIGRSDQRPAL